jgi:hypothetical protein
MHHIDHDIDLAVEFSFDETFDLSDDLERQQRIATERLRREALCVDDNEYRPEAHPTRPEFPSLHHSASNTWLVQHDGGWTGYAPRSIWTERCDTAEQAYRELVKVLQRNDPYETEDVREHRLGVLALLGG